jgi:hypothetical protein
MAGSSVNPGDWTHGALGRHRAVRLLNRETKTTQQSRLLSKEGTSTDRNMDVSVHGSRRELMDSTGGFERPKVVIDQIVHRHRRRCQPYIQCPEVNR